MKSPAWLIGTQPIWVQMPTTIVQSWSTNRSTSCCTANTKSAHARATQLRGNNRNRIRARLVGTNLNRIHQNSAFGWDCTCSGSARTCSACSGLEAGADRAVSLFHSETWREHRFWSQMITCIRFWVGLVVPYKVTMVTHTHFQVSHIFPRKCALFLEYRLVGMRLLHVHQLFDPVLDRTNQTHPKIEINNAQCH